MGATSIAAKKIIRMLEQLKLCRKLKPDLFRSMQMKQVCCRLVASEIMVTMRCDAYALSEAF